MSPSPTVLYLDQNAWIALAAGAWDRTEYPREHAALTVVCEALEAGDIVVPLSFSNQYETMKVNDPARRANLARAQTIISGGRVLRARRRLLEVMLLQRIAEATGIPPPALRHDWFLSDVWLEAVAETSSEPLQSAIPPRVVEYMRSNPRESMFEYLFGLDEEVRKEGVRRFSAESDAHLARIAKRRKRVEGESFALRLRAYSAVLLIDEIDFIFALAQRHGLPWKTVGDIGASLAKRLVSDVPVMNVERQLTVRLEDQARETNANDIRDMNAFVTALPVVDIMVAEKQFVNLSRQAKLDTQYGTRLLTSVHDLTREMMAPTGR